MAETIDMIDQWPPTDGRWSKTNIDHHNMIRSLAITVRQLRNDLENMKLDNGRLKDEIIQLKRERDERVKTWATVANAAGPENTTNKTSELRLIAKMHDDMKERNRIDRNVIVSGLPEDADASVDSRSIDDLVSTLNIDSSKIKRKIRLRKKGVEPQPNRPSLVLIEFDESKLAENAVSNAKKLAETENFKRVYVRRDRTEVERTADSMAREECLKRNRALPHVVEGLPHLRYGIDKSNNKYYWGVRHGRPVKIKRNEGAGDGNDGQRNVDGAN